MTDHYQCLCCANTKFHSVVKEKRLRLISSRLHQWFSSFIVLIVKISIKVLLFHRQNNSKSAPKKTNQTGYGRGEEYSSQLIHTYTHYRL